jgi:hypothetical protein
MTSVLLAVLRVAGIKHPAFQAVAHLWVGFLLGAWAAGYRLWFLGLAVGLSVVEVVCFFVL